MSKLNFDETTKENGAMTNISRIGKQPPHWQDDPEVLMGGNDHFMETINLINVHSEMRYKISCQNEAGVL